VGDEGEETTTGLYNFTSQPKLLTFESIGLYRKQGNSLHCASINISSINTLQKDILSVEKMPD
jgi:hypothetical protein